MYYSVIRIISFALICSILLLGWGYYNSAFGSLNPIDTSKTVSNNYLATVINRATCKHGKGRTIKSLFEAKLVGIL